MTPQAGPSLGHRAQHAPGPSKSSRPSPAGAGAGAGAPGAGGGPTSAGGRRRGCAAQRQGHRRASPWGSTLRDPRLGVGRMGDRPRDKGYRHRKGRQQPQGRQCRAGAILGMRTQALAAATAGATAGATAATAGARACTPMPRCSTCLSRWRRDQDIRRSASRSWDGAGLPSPPPPCAGRPAMGWTG